MSALAFNFRLATFISSAVGRSQSSERLLYGGAMFMGLVSVCGTYISTVSVSRLRPKHSERVAVRIFV